MPTTIPGYTSQLPTPTPESLAAWRAVRMEWVRNGGITPRLLELEAQAKAESPIPSFDA